MKTIFAFLGPSCSGKTTIARILQQRKLIPDCPELISHACRKPRKGEIYGVDYYFIERYQFNKIQKVEYAPYANNHYCLSKKEVDDKFSKYDKAFVIMEKRGIMQLKENLPDFNIEVIYFIAPLEEIAKRLWENRSPREAFERLLNIQTQQEMCHFDIADHIIYNKDGSLEESVQRVANIIN